MSLSLANKYRPQTFDQMIGQHHIIDILKAKMSSNRGSLQNYLLTGPRGTWKTSTARILAKAINCLDPQDGNPCNACANCMTINNETSLDYVERDAASHTQVDKIREEILDRASYAPTVLKKKIYVIDEVHMLSGGSFNALLKMIEEPKGNVCFILATTAVDKVPDTIISRCQVFLFKKVAEAEIVKNLIHICEKEKFEYVTEALDLIAMISDGGVRDSVKYLDQVSVLGKITSENVSKFLGVSSEVMIKSFLMTIKNRDENQIFEAVDQIATQWLDMHQFTKQLLWFINKHFLEDTDFYLQVSEVFGAIMKQVRFYPYPAVIYKVELNKFLGNPTNNDNNNALVPNKPRRDASIMRPNGIDDNNAPTSNTSRRDASLMRPNNETITSSHPDNEQPTSPDPVSASRTGATHHNIGHSAATEATPATPDLRPTILSQLSKPTVQTNLKDHVIIEKIEDNTAHLVVTNKIAEMLLQNKDNKQEIETLLTNHLWTPTTIHFTFETKENYFSRISWL